MQNMPIGIFRGDDTDAFSYQTIVGTINTDLDLTGCKAVFRYLGFSMEFDPIPEDRKLTIVIPADETKKFPPGLGYASLRVYDSEGRLKTFSNRIMVFVATKTPMFGSDEFEVDFNVRASLEPLKFFVGPNPDDFDEYRGYLEKVIDRASAAKYGLAILLDAIDSDLGANDGVAATPVAVKAAYAAIIEKLTDDYYTAEQTEEAIDRVAAYYITYDAAGNPFPTYAALANAQTVYSGGKVRTPTRNDYCVVLADETHQGAEYRYIYAVAEGQTTGSWQPQFPVEGVMTIDQTVTRNSQNPVSGGGVWSAIWGALSALPTGFTSLYDWVVAQLAGKATKADATLTPVYSDTPTFSEWNILHTPLTAEQKAAFYDVAPTAAENDYAVTIRDTHLYVGEYWAADIVTSSDGLSATYDRGGVAAGEIWGPEGTVVATRTVLQGYQLGSQTDKPLASEAEAEALRNDVAARPTKAQIEEGWWSEWVASGDGVLSGQPTYTNGIWTATITFRGAAGPTTKTVAAGEDSETLVFDSPVYLGDVCILTRHRVAAPVPTKPEDIGAQAALSAQQLANIAAVPNKANDADVVHKTGDETIAGVKTFSDYVRSQFFMAYNGDNTGSLYPDYIYFSAYGRTNYLTFPDSQQSDYPNVRYNGFDVLATRDYVQWATPYSLGTPIVIDTASSETVEGETVNYGAATLANRTANQVGVTVALDELRVTIPPAVSGKVRDFGLLVGVGLGEGTALTAPALVPVAPTGETITMVNAEGEMPTLADGTTTSTGLTLLYFSEVAPGHFLVKGEEVKTITQ